MEIELQPAAVAIYLHFTVCMHTFYYNIVQLTANVIEAHWHKINAKFLRTSTCMH